MREILPGILTWAWFSARHGYDFNGWLVRHPEGNLCIDPVEMPDDVLEEISAGGVARVLLTNRNHFRASMRVKERTGARIAIHPADAGFARQRVTAVDDELRPGDRVGPFAVPAEDRVLAGNGLRHPVQCPCSRTRLAWPVRDDRARDGRDRGTVAGQ